MLGLVVTASGCQQSEPAVSSSASDSGAESSGLVETDAEDTAQSTGANVKRSVANAPVVDPAAVNGDGLIVLGSSEAAVSDPAISEVAISELASSELASGQATAGQDAVDETYGLDSAAVDTGDIIIEVPSRPSDAVEGTPTLAASGASLVSDSAPAKEQPSSDSVPSGERNLPAAANVTTEEERNQKIAEDWPQPQAVLFVSGQQHGYVEPCGCTGLDQQKGGLIRRDTLLTQLRDRGWNVLPVDVGNQVRRIGRQPEIKFQTTVEAFKLMGYKAATLGVDDLKLSSVELIQAASSDELNPGAFVLSNVSVVDASFFPTHRIVESGTRKIGITAVLGAEYETKVTSGDVEFKDPIESLKPIVEQLRSEGCDFLVLLSHASIEESKSIAQQVEGFDLVVTAGGFGEPTLNPEPIEKSTAVMVQVGTKGMYGGIVGLFDDETTPLRYQKIAISSQFKDSPRMLERFQDYQTKLKNAGFDALGATPVAHPSGGQFVGSETCGECHTTAYEIWENSPHVHATDSIVAANNDRGGIERHFDPECVSCHVTGWNPQLFYPYASGYEELLKSDMLLGSGCENCHGPGKAHVDAEYGDVEVDNETLVKLQQQMVIKLDQAREKCLECHDLDNSPDFHVQGAFDEYWEQVKHYGKD